MTRLGEKKDEHWENHSVGLIRMDYGLARMMVSETETELRKRSEKQKALSTCSVFDYSLDRTKADNLASDSVELTS